MHATRKLLGIGIAAILLGFCPSAAGAAEVYADLGIGGELSSNVYLDDTREWDVLTVPRLALGVGLAEIWAVEYEGEVDIFARHTELFFHRHALGVSLEPTWGDEGENLFSAGLSYAAQKHADAYEAIDHVEPALELAVELEPAPWLRWTLSQEASYRLFYNDTASDSLDLWTETELAFTLPSRTTLAPRVGYGFRYYPRQDLSVTDDTNDQQITVGAHLSQAVGKRGGLRADYEYLHNLGESGLIARKLTQTEFTYLGEEFLFTGHVAEVGYKQLFESGWSFGLEARFEWRFYDGWIAEDEDGAGSGSGAGAGQGGAEAEASREDQRLAPRAFVEYVWTPDEESSPAVPELSLALSYEYLRQWSNLRAFDTDRHIVGLSLTLSW